MSPQTYDVIVIGAGPAGEALAGRVAAKGHATAIVESHLVGGECSFYACMPSKALLRPAQALAEARRVPGAAEAVTADVDVEAVLRRRRFPGWPTSSPGQSRGDDRGAEPGPARSSVFTRSDVGRSILPGAAQAARHRTPRCRSSRPAAVASEVRRTHDPCRRQPPSPNERPARPSCEPVSCRHPHDCGRGPGRSWAHNPRISCAGADPHITTGRSGGHP